MATPGVEFDGESKQEEERHTPPAQRKAKRIIVPQFIPPPCTEISVAEKEVLSACENEEVEAEACHLPPDFCQMHGGKGCGDDAGNA